MGFRFQNNAFPELFGNRAFELQIWRFHSRFGAQMKPGKAAGQTRFDKSSTGSPATIACGRSAALPQPVTLLSCFAGRARFQVRR